MIIAITYYNKNQDKALKYLHSQDYTVARIENRDAETSRFQWKTSTVYVFDIPLADKDIPILFKWLEKNNCIYKTTIRNLDKFLGGCYEEGNVVIKYK